MNYHILPKNKFNIKIEPDIKWSSPITPFISYSLIYYLNDIYNQILSINEDSNSDVDINIEHINHIINPFEFIHRNVPGCLISVSKVKPDSSVFFELMEIFQICNISDFLSLKTQINIAHITPNHSSSNYLLNMLREENMDNVLSMSFDYDLLVNMFINNEYSHKMDLLIFELNDSDYISTNVYIRNMLLILYITAKYQMNNGICIIKIDHVFYKSIIDILFIFSGLFEKMFLIKPSISNITKGDRFIICKFFDSNYVQSCNLISQLETNLIKNITEEHFDFTKIKSLITNDIPYYFLNKIEESNIVIGQQQLESYDQIINIYKNKNRDEKIESIKRNHIHKCIQWCEKNQLPHNKFIDKVNIFLTPKKKECDEVN